MSVGFRRIRPMRPSRRRNFVAVPDGRAQTRRMTDMGAFRESVTAWAAGGPGDLARELAARLSVRTVVLLEGPSDLAAVDALAAGRGRDLEAEGVCVLAMNGAMSVGRFARLLGPSGLGLRLTGLCDEAERGYYARALEQDGPEGNTARRQEFFVCAADLEDELIRALGVSRVEELVRAEGDLRALRTFVRQLKTARPFLPAAVEALPRDEEGSQDPLRPCPRRGPLPRPRTRSARRLARRGVSAPDGSRTPFFSVARSHR